MPLFGSFIVPKVTKKLLDEIKTENDPALQFAEEFLDQFVWDLLAVKVPLRPIHGVDE